VEANRLFRDSRALTGFFSREENIAFLMLSLPKEAEKVNACK
jgi:hypothetical protein